MTGNEIHFFKEKKFFNIFAERYTQSYHNPITQTLTYTLTLCTMSVLPDKLWLTSELSDYRDDPLKTRLQCRSLLMHNNGRTAGGSEGQRCALSQWTLFWQLAASRKQWTRVVTLVTTFSPKQSWVESQERGRGNPKNVFLGQGRFFRFRFAFKKREVGSIFLVWYLCRI